MTTNPFDPRAFSKPNSFRLLENPEQKQRHRGGQGRRRNKAGTNKAGTNNRSDSANVKSPSQQVVKDSSSQQVVEKQLHRGRGGQGRRRNKAGTNNRGDSADVKNSSSQQVVENSVDVNTTSAPAELNTCALPSMNRVREDVCYDCLGDSYGSRHPGGQGNCLCMECEAIGCAGGSHRDASSDDDTQRQHSDTYSEEKRRLNDSSDEEESLNNSSDEEESLNMWH